VQDIRPFPNLYIDTSGSQCSSGIVEYALSVLGADRILYGSDIPGRDFSVQLGRIYGARMSDVDRAKVLYGNAERLLGLGVPGRQQELVTPTGQSAGLGLPEGGAHAEPRGQEHTMVGVKTGDRSTLFDVNTALGRWPFATFEQDTAGELSDHLAAEGVDLALVSSIETALFPDPHIPNLELIDALESAPNLLPLVTLDPTLSHWRDCLDIYRDRVSLNAVRVLPNYHRYILDDPRLDELAVVLQEGDHPVLVVQMRLEDERGQYPLMQVPGVPVAGIVALAQRHPSLSILCLCPYRPEAIELVRSTGNVFVDIAFVEFKDTLASLLAHIPADRILFGSHTPMLYTRAALMKMEHARADKAEIEAVSRTNALRLFGIEFGDDT